MSNLLTAQDFSLALLCAGQVREHPLYHLIKAQAQRKMGELQEAIQTLQLAMSLPGMKRVGSAAKSKARRVELSAADCVSVYLELAEALWLNGEQVTFASIMQKPEVNGISKLPINSHASQ